MAAIGGLLVLVAIDRAWSPAQTQPARTEARPFAGKLLALSYGDRGRPDVLLAEVRVQRLGDQPFLVGKIPDDEQFDLRGKTLWVPLTRVARMMEFDSVRQFTGAFNADGN